jgi:uncharacterized surface protein with fasciclin (FAS1) repeats
MKVRSLIFLAVTLMISSQITAQKYKSTASTKVLKTYQGIEFSSEKTLLENLTEADGFSIYAEILENHAAELFTENFMGTVFVVTDAGFVSNKEENESFDFSETTYQKFQLQYFTVPGRLDAYSIKKAIQKGGGSARFSTIEGIDLEIRMSGDILYLYSSEEMKAKIIATDFYHKNGFFHIVDGPLIPEISKN